MIHTHTHIHTCVIRWSSDSSLWTQLLCASHTKSQSFQSEWKKIEKNRVLDVRWLCCLSLSPACETYPWFVKNVKCLFFFLLHSTQFWFALLSIVDNDSWERKRQVEKEKSSYTWVDRNCSTFFYFCLDFARALFKRMICDFSIHSNHFVSTSLCWTKKEKVFVAVFSSFHTRILKSKKNCSIVKTWKTCS